jgi:hypothetical protein
MRIGCARQKTAAWSKTRVNRRKSEPERHLRNRVNSCIQASPESILSRLSRKRYDQHYRCSP